MPGLNLAAAAVGHMRVWKHRGGGDWDLAVVVYAIVALSAATDVYGFQRFAPTLGLPAWAGALWVIPVKFVEWRFLAFATRLNQSGWLGTIVCPVPVLAWSLAACLSMLAADSSIYDLFASADRVSAKAAETRENLTAAFEGVKAQLALVSKPLPRPSKFVEQALGWEPLLPETTRRATRDCTRLVGDAMPEACRKRVELRKELAAAIEYEHLSQRSEKLRIELQGLGAEAGGNSMARSFNLSLGRFVELEGKDGIALMGMTILTLTSCFGPFGLYLIGKAGRPTSPTAASASPNSRPTQVNGQGGVTAQTQYVPPSSSKSAHDRPASDPAQPARQPAHAGLEEESETAQGQSVHGHTRPAQKSAQADSVPPAREQACSRDKSAHESAQASLRQGAGSARFQPAHDHQQAARPPIVEPAESLTRRAGQTKRPAHRDVRTAHGSSSKVVHLAVPDGRREALSAVRSFVAMLEHAPSARAAGSALADAYESLRAGQGWPEVPRNVFGILLRIAVEELGGRKLKNGGQVYVGVRIPAGWGMPVAA